MPFVADLHVHSYLSRATSRELDLEHLHAWAQRKGITVVATGDFTHPRWLAELRDKLVPAEAGLFRLRDDLAKAVDETVPAACRAPVRFMLSVEVSSIYKQADRVRKVHNLVYAPNLEVAATIASRLARIGNIESDGRPILGLSSRDLLAITLESSPDAFLIPAHIWTPWFSALGEKSGFDSLDACFGDLASHIFAAETGLSSDPAMNWRLSALDRVTLVSSSDAHSPEKLGREASRFACELSYFEMRDALRSRNAGFLGTVEFFPEEGKYHHEGHRACGVSVSPAEAATIAHVCPRCEKPLTGGVASRVAALADRPDGFRPDGAKPFTSLVPLVEVLGEILGVGPSSSRVRKWYDQLLGRAGSEMTVLSDFPTDDADREGPPLLGEALRRMRAGDVKRTAGFDGEYGIVRVFDEEERRQLLAQTIFAFANGPRVEESRPALAPRKKQAEEQPVVIVATDDKDQAAAITHPAGPLVIVAGPGAGKTRTLVGRIAWLIGCGADAASITAITFTRKAANELRERLQSRIGAKATAVTATTFHAFCLSLLREFHSDAGLPRGFFVLDEGARRAVVEKIVHASGLDIDRAKVLHALSRAKADATSTAPSDEIAALLPLYAAELENMGAIDFDDLVLRAVQLLESCPAASASARARCQHLLVDEYQDVNAGQYRLVRLLAPDDSNNLCVVGDPDQAIYGFRGSDPSYFARFAQDYPRARTITLARNYRSAAPVVELAKAVIVKAAGRNERPLIAQIPAGPPVSRQVFADDHAEADGIAAEIERAVGGTSMLGAVADGHHLAFHDIAVLTRLSAQADVIEEALDRLSIPCQRAGNDALTSRPHVADLLSRLHRRIETKGKALLADALATVDPDAGIDPRRKRALDLLCTLALPFGDDLDAFLAAIPLWTETDVDLAPQKVSLLTLHASKGLEFPLVFIAGCEDGLIPLWLPWLPAADVEEERRLLYVGMTRAKQRLVLTAVHKRNMLGRTVENRACPFLDRVPAGLFADQIVAARARRPKQLSLL